MTKIQIRRLIVPLSVFLNYSFPLRRKHCVLENTIKITMILQFILHLRASLGKGPTIVTMLSLSDF